MKGLVDVLVGSHKGVDCRFYFDPADGRLLALEMFPDNESDPCEIYFSQYREIDGRDFPGRLEVRYGDEPFGAFSVIDFRIEKTRSGERGAGREEMEELANAMKQSILHSGKVGGRDPCCRPLSHSPSFAMRASIDVLARLFAFFALRRRRLSPKCSRRS